MYKVLNQDRLNKRILFIILAAGIFFHPLYSYNEETPVWVLFEEAKLKFNQKEYGLSLELFKKVIEKQGLLPEAEIFIGDIYIKEKEFKLAESYFDSAYKNKKFLEIPDDVYPLLYKRLDIYSKMDEYEKWFAGIAAIIKENPLYLNETFNKLKENYFNIYINSGFDRFIILFRTQVPHVIRAHAELAWLTYKTKQYKASIIHSLYSINIVLSTAIKELHRQDIGYEYKTLDGFFQEAFTWESVRSYLINQEIFKKLYYLAAASYAYGKNDLAVYLWDILSKINQNDQYIRLSRVQRVDPWIEEPIFVDFVLQPDYLTPYIIKKKKS